MKMVSNEEQIRRRNGTLKTTQGIRKILSFGNRGGTMRPPQHGSGGGQGE